MSLSPPRKIELTEETEGDRVSVSDLVFFHTVGEPLRIIPEASAAGDGGSHSVDWLPTQPIAVSDKHGLLFIAHSSGFCVARTKDVIEAAKGKGSGGCSVMEMSVVNVDIGNVRSLSLSWDSSVIAVCAGPDVSFFSVDLLLNKEEGSLRSSSIDVSTFVKDFRWLKTTDNSFTILSGSGKLYNGSVGGPLKSMMDEVDAVECSLKGKSIVVAKSNNLSFLTTKFKEKLCISLAGPSWTGESDASYKVKVDSIRWVRFDSIVLGCFQLQSDGTEENYFLQVIRSKDGKITDTSTEMVVQSFYYVFPGMIDDIVPTGNGPYLFLSYLDQCKLAVTAHRKNIEEHMIFFSWSVTEANDEVVFVEINRNKWIPKIELQENEEDNLILGLCSCKVSLDEKVRIQMSSDLRELELSPFSVIFSVTVEGKLVMHHVSSPIELSDSSDVQGSEDEEDTQAMKPSEQISATTLVKGSLDHGPIGGQFQDIRTLESSTRKEGEATSGRDLKPLKITQSQTPTFPISQTENNESMAGKWGVNSVALPQKSNSDAKQISHVGDQSVGISSKEGPFGGILTGVSPQLKIPTFATPVFFEKSRTLTGQWKMESHAPQVSGADGRQHAQMVNHAVGVQYEQGLLGGKQGIPSQQSAAPVFLSKELKDSLGRNEITQDHNRLGSVETSRSLTQETPVVWGGSRNQYSPLLGEERSGTQLGKIKGMINELDTLLSSLEERGAFGDACTVAMKGLVETVENEIGLLSNHCLMWKGINERENEIQDLLAKSIQAVVVKEHIKILLKQVSDPHYRELWSRQKLSSELELKRKNILKLNQELTNRLIELERHLNSLEFNKYGDITAAYRGLQASESGYGRRRSTAIGSRSTHSFQSLYSTITSQIASAEQLSDCLSRQMSALSVESPPSRPNNVKKELFDSIGLPYEDSFCSPDPGKLPIYSLDKRALISSNLVAPKDLSMDIQSSALKHSEPETARRRRDSLGLGWKSFTPSKTTVERIILQGQHDQMARQSFKNDMTVDSLQKSVLSRPSRTTPTFKLQFENDGSPGKKVTTESPLMPYNKVDEGARFLIRTSQATSVPQLSASKGSASDGWNKMNIGNNFVSEKTIAGTTIEKSTSVKETQMKPAIVRESNSFNGSNISIDSSLNEDMPTVAMKSLLNSPMQPSVISSSFLKERTSAISRSENQKDRLKKDETPLVGSGKIDSLPSIAHAGPKALPFAEEVPPFGAVPGQSLPVGVTSSATSLEPALSWSLSISNSSSAQPISFSAFKSANPFAGVSLVGTPAISKGGKETSQTSPFGFLPSASASASPVASTVSLSSSSASSSFTPSSSFQLKSSAFQDKMPETGKLDVKPEQDKDIQRLDATPSTEVKSESLSGGSPVKVEAPTVVTPGTSRISPAMASKLQESSDQKESLALNKLLDTPAEKPSVGNAAFPFALSTAGNFACPKTDSVDIADSEEDEMEEEAPDTNNKPDLGLGGLGGFGLGSTPSNNIPKGNPFGVSFSSASSMPASSPFSMAVPSGELFRPASFSFQSPQTSQPSQPPTMSAFSGGFGVATAQSPTQSGFGQLSHIGPGQPALGSVLGTFGQSRQIGSGFAHSGGFGGGFPAAGSSSGLAGAASTGGFASLTSSGSGFAGGGFASVAPAGGGFGGFAASSGGGFTNAATGSGFSQTGFGFGAFGGQQGAGGFSAFGGSGGAGNAKPPELFTQIRK